MSDVFDDLLALLTPERLLRDPRATGEGVSVCVIDSGVERAVLEEKFRRQGQEILPIEGGIFTAAQAEPLPYTGHQSTPHGTTVADILLTVAPVSACTRPTCLAPPGPAKSRWSSGRCTGPSRRGNAK